MIPAQRRILTPIFSLSYINYPNVTSATFQFILSNLKILLFSQFHPHLKSFITFQGSQKFIQNEKRGETSIGEVNNQKLKNYEEQVETNRIIVEKKTPALKYPFSEGIGLGFWLSPNKLQNCKLILVHCFGKDGGGFELLLENRKIYFRSLSVNMEEGEKIYLAELIKDDWFFLGFESQKNKVSKDVLTVNLF